MYLNNGVYTNLPPPAGYIVDFDDPQRRGLPDVYYVAGFGCFISLLFIIQRFYTRLVVEKTLHVDDYLLLAGYATALATIGLTVVTFARVYAGVHAWEIPETNFCFLLKYSYASWAIYILCSALVKSSLLSFYLRLSPKKSFRVATWIAIAFVITYTIGLIPTLVAGCRFEDGRLGGDDRVTCPAVNMASAVLNIISDVIIFILPIPMVLKLQVRPAQKVGLILIFAVGSATVITSIVRAALLPAMLDNPDQSWEVTYVSIWVIIEANLMIICAALPTLRKFFQHAAPRSLVESWYGSSKSTDATASFQKPSVVTIGGGNDRRRTGGYGGNDLDQDISSSDSLPIQNFPQTQKSSTEDLVLQRTSTDPENGQPAQVQEGIGYAI